MLISEAFNEYIKARVISVGGSLKTAESYQYAAKSFIGFAGDIDVEDITLEKAQSFYLYEMNRLDQSTVRLYLLCLRAVLKLCYKRGYKVLDTDELLTPKRKKTYVAVLSDNDMRLFFNCLERRRRGKSEAERLRDLAIALTLQSSGARISEICNLNRKDIHGQQFIAIGKSKRPRPCYISEEAANMIQRYLSMRHDSNAALFVCRSGKRCSPADVRYVFRKISKEIGVQVHPHLFRHTFATNLHERGVDIAYIAEFLGHESLETTKIYTHVCNPRLQAIHSKIISTGPRIVLT